MVSSTIVLAIYLAAFACLHSFLASLKVKRIVYGMVGPKVNSWYLPGYTIISGIVILPLVYYLFLNPGQILYIVPFPWRWMMVGGQAVMGLLTYRAFHDALPYKFEVTAEISEPGTSDAGPLQIKGIYRWIRDPFFFIGVLFIWLTPFMTTNLLVLYLMTTFYFYLGSRHWEMRLISQFGDAYRDYQKQVPRIIPWKGAIYPQYKGK